MKRMHMHLKHLFVAALITCAAHVSLFAQESFGGIPASFEAPSAELRSALAPNVVREYPNFNPEDLRAQNDWEVSDVVHTKPLIIGRIIDMDVDFMKQAKRAQLSDGRIIYRLAVETKGAHAINLYYKDFFIPKGGALYIYTPDRKSLLGAYTYDTHPNHGEFATEPLPGSSLIMEYVFPLGGDEKALAPSIHIEGLNYIFRNLPQFSSNLRAVDDPGEDQANENCTVNVNCPDGAAWQTEKTGVVQMMMNIDGNVGLCTGNLLNNTNEDFAPYIISAAHCVSITTQPPSRASYNQFIFSFHYEKPSCSGAGFALSRIKTMVGCQPKAFLPIAGKSDGLLLLLNKKIPDAYRVYYNGWDRSAKVPEGGAVGMHHPAGDAKKISVCKGGITIGQWKSQDETGGKEDHFRLNFANQSNTQGGSSGSSLWDSNTHLVIGTLSGGSPGCFGYNLYGRLSSHWDKYKDLPDFANGIKTHMDVFLDPKNGGTATSLKGTWKNNMKPLLAVKDVNVTLDESRQNVVVSWKGIDQSMIPENTTVVYRIYRNGKYVSGKDVPFGTNTFTESVAEAKKDFRTNGSVYYGVEVRYKFPNNPIPDDGYNRGKDYIYDDSDIVTNGMYINNVIRELNPISVSESKAGGIEVVWHSPNNVQEISNYGYPSVEKQIPITFPEAKYIQGNGLATGQRCLVASKYHIEGLDPQQKSYVSAVSFIPLTKPEPKDLYQVVIRNGGQPDKPNIVRQSIEFPSDWKPGEWVTVLLKKPVQIDPLKPIYIGYSCKNKRNSSQGIQIIANTSDDEMSHRDFLLSGDDGRSFFKIANYGTAVNGYAAIRAYLSPTSKSLKDTPYQVIARTKLAVPFPVVKGYNIYRDGKKINSDLLTSIIYVDKEGTTSSKYKIEVVYEDAAYNDAQVIEQAKTPSVYPTHIGADGVLNVDNANTVNRLSIVALDGTVVKSINNPESVVDLSDLQAGNYVVVMDTASQRITVRISR